MLLLRSSLMISFEILIDDGTHIVLVPRIGFTFEHTVYTARRCYTKRSKYQVQPPAGATPSRKRASAQVAKRSQYNNLRVKL